MAKQNLNNPYELTVAKETIKRLEEYLYEAREDLINLVPYDLSNILLSYYSCVNRSQTNGWRESIIDKILSHAKLLSRDEGVYFGDRAYCPLCGKGTSAPYEKGFSHPEGLRRHLDGYGQSRQCSPMKAAYSLAVSHWNQKFGEDERREAEEKIKDEAERRKSETLYVLSLYGEPQLIRKNNGFLPPRDETQLLWAEARLVDLKFTISKEGNVKSYTKEYGEHIVYADPLTFGRIGFSLYKKPLKKDSRRLSRSSAFGHYSIPDKWKNNLATKLDAFINGATK